MADLISPFHQPNDGGGSMKTLQINDNGSDSDTVKTILHEGKSAKDVLRERFEDTCVLKPIEQPKSISTTTSHPTTYIVENREGCDDRKEEGQWAATLVEIP